MARIHRGLLALALGASIGAGACNKTKHADTVVSNGARTASMGDPKSDLTFLPADSDLVLDIDVEQIKQSALWGQYAPPFVEKLNAALGDFKAACGFSPVDEVRSVAIGMKNLGADQPDAVIVVRGPKRTLMTSGCVAKLQTELQKDGSTFTVDGDTYSVVSKDGRHGAMRFVGDTTLVLATGVAGTKDGLAAIAKGGAGLDTSPTFTALLKGIDRTHSVWFALNGNSPVMAQLAAIGAKPKAVFGSINVSDGLTFDGAMRFGTPDEAQSLLALSKQVTQSPMVAQMFDKLDINATGTDLTASAAMGPQKLKAVVQQMMTMMGDG